MIWSIILGAFSGWVASIIMKKNDKMGALANIGVGLVGGFLGNFIAGLLGIVTTSSFSVGGIAISILGSCLFIWILNKFRR